MPRALAMAFMVMARVFNSASSARATLSVSVPPGPLPYEGLPFGCVGPREPPTTTMVLNSYAATTYLPGGLRSTRLLTGVEPRRNARQQANGSARQHRWDRGRGGSRPPSGPLSTMCVPVPGPAEPGKPRSAVTQPPNRSEAASRPERSPSPAPQERDTNPPARVVPTGLGTPRFIQRPSLTPGQVGGVVSSTVLFQAGREGRLLLSRPRVA
jgi:hypothetical protein